MVLGDNIFYGNGLAKMLKLATLDVTKDRATIFGYYVSTPERFGVVSFDEQGKAISIDEKPQHPNSNYAVTGLYFYPGDVTEKAKTIKPSARGELEITTLNEMYLRENRLNVKLLESGFAWLDTGTTDSLLSAANFVATIEQRQGITICAPEVIAYNNGWINKESLLRSIEKYGASSYGEYLKTAISRKMFFDYQPCNTD